MLKQQHIYKGSNFKTFNDILCEINNLFYKFKANLETEFSREFQIEIFLMKRNLKFNSQKIKQI